jgi:hypothetical protein
MGYDKDVMIVAVVGKLLVFALAFLLLWFGNRRGWKWFALDEAMDKKTYLRRWGILMGISAVMVMGGLVVGAMMEMKMLLGLEAGKYLLLGVLPLIPVSVVLYALMLAVVIKRAKTLRHEQGAIIATLALMPPLNMIAPAAYWLPCLVLYFMTEKDTPEGRENEAAALMGGEA